MTAAAVPCQASVGYWSSLKFRPLPPIEHLGRLRYGARQIGWAFRSCSGTRGLDERAGHERRLRHLVEKLRSHPMFGRRREGRSWAEEYRRQERRARAETELARRERRGLKTMARIAGVDPRLL